VPKAVVCLPTYNERENIEPMLADARTLPFEDDSFDGAYLVTVLGEIPDQDAALRELRRVVRSGGSSLKRRRARSRAPLAPARDRP